jgi:hypothetical protein
MYLFSVPERIWKMAKAWKDEKFSFLDARKVSHRVGDQDMDFYPVSLGVMIELRETAKLIGKAVAVLWSPTAGDSGTIERVFASDTQKGVMDREVIVEAVRPETVKLRAEIKQKAVGDIIDGLMAPENVGNFGKLLMDSLRSMFPPGHPDNPSPGEFIRALDMPTIVEMTIGAAKANKGMFGPLVERIASMKDAILKGIEDKITAAGAKPPASPSPSDDPGSTPGSNSRINSSGSSNEGTTPPASSSLPSISSPASTSPASV